MSTLETLEDKTNGLLKRREIRCLFKGYAGKLTRKEAVEMVSKELKLDKTFVIPLSLQCETGTNDVYCTFYVYDDEDLAKKHLPKYVFTRLLTEEERKAAKEAEKAKSAEAAPEATEALKEKAKEKETEAKVEKPKKEAPAEEKKTEDKSEKPKKEVKGKDKSEEEKK